MPIYEYECANCGHEMEELQTMSELPLSKCPNCGKDELRRLIGSGGGLIFKGSGFYQTDYVKNKDDSKKTDKKEKQAEKPAVKKETSSNTKPE